MDMPRITTIGVTPRHPAPAARPAPTPVHPQIVAIRAATAALRARLMQRG